ncbi:ARM [Seminavis robusta]|uniref:ARM n=1 Tax=Seminavis robusta TaxID=568900 RepID=A0A9N8DJW6_9STRA|nr:ARM [Seminavis robusta]|eukprot:Sro162_g072890.1 ARM (1013) ;mRNA; f:62261-65299
MMNAEGCLTLMERHVHEAEVTWAEGRLKLAKSGFCDQHPYIRLRKKKWFGKEKVILNTCPRCDEEHQLRMDVMRVQLEHMKQTLRVNGSPVHGNAATALPAATAAPLSLAPPTLPQLSQQTATLSAASTPAPLSPTPPTLPQLTAAQPEETTPPKAAREARGRFARLMSSRGKPQTMSCQNLDQSAIAHSLPERSSSCRAVLGVIPDEGEHSDDEGEDEIEEPQCHQCLRHSTSFGDLPGSLLQQNPTSLPQHSFESRAERKKEDPPVWDPNDFIQDDDDEEEEVDLRAEASSKPAPEPARKFSPEPARKFSPEPFEPAATSSPKPRQPSPDTPLEPAPLVPAKQPTPKEPKSPEPQHKEPKPSELPQHKKEAPKREDTMWLAKEQEKRRKRIGAVAMNGNSSTTSTLQDMTEFAKYAMSSVTEFQQAPTVDPESPTGVKDCSAIMEQEALPPCLLNNTCNKDLLPQDKVNAKINALKWSCRHPHQAEEVLHELQALCQDSEDNQITVVMGDGLGSVLDIMRAFPLHAGVQEEACWVLGTLACENDDHKSLIAEAGGIIAIVSAMKRLGNHSDFQETAFEVLTHLTEGHLLNKIAVCESGGVTAIVEAMERHLSCCSVQARGCAALENLAVDGAQTVIVESGGISAVFAAMMEHKYDADLQACACAALGNLAYNNATAKFLIAQAGGIGFILAAIRNHDREVSVLEPAYFALQNLAHDNPDNKDMMVDCGVINAVLDCLLCAQVPACETLIMIIRNHSKAKDALAQLGGVAAMVVILRSPSTEDCSVQQAACRVLMNLAHKHDNNKVLIAGVGGVSAIMCSMIQFANVAEFQECACETLTSLTVHDENKILLAEAYGIDVVVAAMSNHPNHCGIQAAGCRVLVNLARSESLRETITECGGVVAILAAMDNHAENATIQEKACGALRELAMNDSNEVIIVEAGGVEAILAATKMHEHRGFLRNACGALRNLAFHDEELQARIAEATRHGPLREVMEHLANESDGPSDSSSASA